MPSPATGGSNQTAIRAVVVRYAHALAAGDGQALCALLDGTAQQQLAQFSGSGALSATSATAAGCAQAIAQTAAKLSADQRAALDAIVVRGVVVEGDVATVSDSQLTAPGAARPSGAASDAASVVLVRQGSVWLISQIG